MEKNEAKKQLMENGRYNFKVEFAREICGAFGVELDESLIRTTRGYREDIKDPSEPRVTCCDLAKYICEKIGKKPNQKQYAHSCHLIGVGSWMDAESKAYAMSL